MVRELFSLDSDGAVEILPHVWLLEAFRNIRDKYKSTEIATLEVGLIYFSADYRSALSSDGNIEEVVNTVKKELYSQRNIKIDELTYKAISFYKEDQDKNLKIKLLRTITKALQKAISTIDTLAVTELKEIKELAEIISKLPGMLDSLDSLEVLVKKEKEMDSGTVGTGEKGEYEDIN